MTYSRPPHDDARGRSTFSLARDLEVAADSLGVGAGAVESGAGAHDGRVEPLAIIGDDELELSLPSGEVDAHRIRPSMPGDVVQQFLEEQQEIAPLGHRDAVRELG